MRPMLATPAPAVPDGGDWAHEVKWDGMRVLVDVREGAVRVCSRTERDVSIAFPELLAPASGLADFGDLLLDGEVVVLRDGRPAFGALAERFNVTSDRVAHGLAASAPATLMAFDVLRVAGTDVTSRPLHVRRELLEGAGLGSRTVQVPQSYADGHALAAATAEQGMEGIVSKRLGSTYLPGRRSEDWRKVVHRRTDSFVVGGWRPENGAGTRLGALLIGAPTPAGLLFRGRIGSGLAGAAGARLLEQLHELATDHDPFTDEVPAQDRSGARWVRPELVVDLEFHGLSEGGRLRQPSWRGVRGDLTPAELVRTRTDEDAADG